MAAITTAAPGAWNTGGTWTGGVKPGNGDTATINHAVTVSTSEIVGTSPVAGTVVLTINAALTIQNGGTLRLRGDAVVGNVAFTVDQGGSLIFDSSLAASPSTTKYRCKISSANNQANAYFVTAGVLGNRASVSSDAGGAHGFFDGGLDWTRGGKVKCTRTDFTRIGDDANYAFRWDLNSSGSDQSFLDYCIFDDCAGPGHVAAYVDGTTFRLLRTTWKNSGANLQPRFGSTDTVGSGERSVTFCVFDLQPQIYGPGNMTIDDNYFHHVPDFTANIWASCKRNLIRLTGTEVFLCMAAILDNYFLYDEDHSNPHFLTPEGSLPAFTIDGCIFELVGTDDQGDCILMPSSDVPQIYDIVNCIVLPGIDTPRNQAGTIASALGDADTSFRVRNCTHYSSGGSPGLSLGETVPGFVDMLLEYKDNICWSEDTSFPGVKMRNQDTPPGVTDLCRAINADFNCGFGLAAGRMGHGYDTPMSGSPGVHDVDVDPQFLDKTRKVSTWDTSLGGAGTSTNAIAELQKINDPAGYNTAYNIPALIAYVRAGFAPQNPALWRSGSRNQTIGAVQVATTATAANRKRLAITQRAG